MEHAQGRHIFSETQIREALTGAAVGLWSWQVPADELTVNHYGQGSTEVAQPEVIGSVSTFESTLPPDDSFRVMALIRHAIQQDAPFEIEHRINTQAGGWQWILTRGQVVERDTQGAVIRVAGVRCYSTKEQPQKNGPMAVPDEVYSTILSSISDTVLITNEAGEFKFICPNIHVIFGYADKEIAQMGTIHRLLGRDLIAQFPLGGLQEIRNIEVQIKDKQTETHILLVNMKAVSIFGGTILFTCRDITERKQVEEMSQEESARAQQYLDIAEVVMVALGRNEEITLINQKGCKTLGYSETELIGKNWIQTFVPEEERNGIRQDFHNVLENKLESFEYYENDLIVRSGERRRFAWHTALYRNLAGEIMGILSSGEDITERRRAEEALRLQTNEMRAQADRIETINQRLQEQLRENRLAGQALAENEAALATLINNVDDSIFSIDKDSRLISFNTAFEQRAKIRLGITLHRGMIFADHFPETYLNVYLPLFDRVLAGESFMVSRHVYMPEKGIDSYNEISCNPINSVAGEVGGAAIFVRDVTESKRAEIALRRSEERFRSVVENVPLAFHIYDFQQDEVVYANPLFEWMYRYVTETDKVDLKIWYERVYPEDRPAVLGILDSDGTRLTGEHEFRIMFPSGNTRHMRQLNFPIIETDNVIRQMASFTEDISERKQIERTIRQSERLLDSVINHALYGIVAMRAIRDADGKIIDFEYRLVNSRVAQQFQHPPAEMIGRRLSDEYPTAMSDGLFDHFVEVVESGQILDFEYAPVNPSRQAHFRISGLKLEDGLVATYADITEQKKSQDALMQNRALLESILKNLPIGVAVTSLEGKVLSVNDRYAARLRQHPDELLDHNIAGFFTKEELAIWNKDNAVVLSTGQSIQSELEEMVADTRHTLLVDHFPLRDSEGNTFGIGRLAVDITEQKQIQNQLRDLSRQIVDVQEKERRHIARELHDEVGQSLTGILLLLNKVKQSSSDVNAATVEQIQTLIRELMAEIRELSHSLHPPILDNHGLPDALRWYCDHYSAQTQIQVTFTYTGLQRRLLPEIELTCYRVVQESLTNVARYAQINSAVVKVSVSQERIKLTVEDKGTGFDVAAARARNSTFGLQGMNERIELLRGTIDIVSSPGQGTRISVEIPLETIELQN